MNIIFIMKDGIRKNAAFTPGDTILKAAERADIHLNSHCEGQGICGGCHVIIKDQKSISHICEREEIGLDRASHVTIYSRLACQVILNENNDGLEVCIV